MGLSIEEPDVVGLYLTMEVDIGYTHIGLEL